MFDPCKFNFHKDKKCAYSTNGQFCGFAKPNNVIEKFKACPLQLLHEKRTYAKLNHKNGNLYQQKLSKKVKI